jgi:hypothetical protein
MPAADELFRTTAGNGTLTHAGRGEEDGQRPAQAPARERGPGGHNAVGHPGAAPANGTVKSPVQSPAQTSAQGPAQAPARVTPPAEPAATPAPVPPPVAQPDPEPKPARKVTAPRRPSGRERHDEKITVYVSPDELLGLEHARITLRGEYGVAVDRGRIVREAVAALLADLDARGRDSILVKRLSGN